MREINRSLPDGVVEKNGLCSYRSGERHIEKVRNNLLEGVILATVVIDGIDLAGTARAVSDIPLFKKAI